MSQKELDQITDLAKNLLDQLDFQNIELEVTKDDEAIHIQLITSLEDSGMLIGFHGETLAALQLILGQMAYKKFGEWKKIFVNIGDYRQKRQEALKNMAQNSAKRVKLTNQPLTLPYLRSNERRIIHMTLSEDPEVETTSEGEGRERRLIINPSAQEKTKTLKSPTHSNE